MAPRKNDQTLDRTYRQVLAQGNAEQNQHYPPNVFDTHYNAVTSFILTEGVKVFGENQYIKDLLRPFLKVVLLPVKFGKAELPEDYRHYTGASIFVKKDFSDCMVIDELSPNTPPTKEQLQDAQEKSKSISWDVDMVEEDEYSDITNNSYKFPTWEFPIGCIFESDYIKVCPYEIPFIELHYIRQPSIYKYGYGTNTDDSIYYAPTMTGFMETEWRTNADDLLFKAMNTLYAMYVRDGELGNAMAALKEKGLF